MIKYMRLQLFLVSKRMSTYIVPTVFAAILFLIIGLPIILGDQKVSLNPINLILPFIISAIFVAIKALNIFKDSEEDGTELLIVSKPITRFRLVLGKFMSLYTLILFFSIFAFLSSALIGTLDKESTSIEILKFAISVGVGTLVIQLLLSSLIVFLASILGKIGTMTTSIVLPLTLVIASMILIPMSGSTLTPYNNDFSHNDFSHKYVVQQTNGKWEEKALNGYDSNPKNNEEMKKDLATHEKSWYKTAAYFDVWTQLSSFYSIFQPQEVTPSTSSKWVGTNEHAMLSDKMDPKLVVKDASGTFFMNPNLHRFHLDAVTKAENIYKSISVQVGKEIDKLAAPLDSIDLQNKMINIIKSKSSTQINDLTEEEVISTYFFINLIKDKKTTKKLPTLLKGGNWSNLSLMKEDTIDYTLIKGSPYVPTSLLYAIWLIITFGVGGLVILRYSRRDFK